MYVLRNKCSAETYLKLPPTDVVSIYNYSISMLADDLILWSGIDQNLISLFLETIERKRKTQSRR